MKKQYVVIENKEDCPMPGRVKEVADALYGSTIGAFAEFEAKRWNGKVVSVAPSVPDLTNNELTQIIK